MKEPDGGQIGAESPSRISPDFDYGIRKSMDLVLSLIRLQEGGPPASVAVALARATGQLQTLTALYRATTETGCGEFVPIKAWCSTFVASIDRGQRYSGRIAFSSDSDAVMPFAMVHVIGLILGELVEDAIARAILANRASHVQITLAASKTGGLEFRVHDEERSSETPGIASSLAASIGGRIHSERAAASTEYRLSLAM